MAQTSRGFLGSVGIHLKFLTAAAGVPPAGTHPRLIFPHQPLVFLHRREFGKAPHRAGFGEGELGAGEGLHEGAEPAGVVEHGRAHVDERHALGPGEHPGHAVAAEEVVRVRPVQAADDRLALRHPEAVGRDDRGQRIGRGGHLLAAAAMAGAGRQRRLRHADCDPAAAARARERKRNSGHGGLLGCAQDSAIPPGSHLTKAGGAEYAFRGSRAGRYRRRRGRRGRDRGRNVDGRKAGREAPSPGSAPPSPSSPRRGKERPRRRSPSPLREKESMAPAFGRAASREKPSGVPGRPWPAPRLRRP